MVDVLRFRSSPAVDLLPRQSRLSTSPVVSSGMVAPRSLSRGKRVFVPVASGNLSVCDDVVAASAHSTFPASSRLDEVVGFTFQDCEVCPDFESWQAEPLLCQGCWFEFSLWACARKRYWLLTRF